VRWLLVIAGQDYSRGPVGKSDLSLFGILSAAETVAGRTQRRTLDGSGS